MAPRFIAIEFWTFVLALTACGQQLKTDALSNRSGAGNSGPATQDAATSTPTATPGPADAKAAQTGTAANNDPVTDVKLPTPSDPINLTGTAELTSITIGWTTPPIAIDPVLGHATASQAVATVVNFIPGSTPPTTCAGGQAASGMTITESGLQPASGYSYRICTVAGTTAGTGDSSFSPGLTGTLWTRGAPSVTDASFEQTVLSANSFEAIPAGAAWAQGAIFSDNGSGYQSSNAAPDGTQVLVLQAGGTTSQTVTGWDATKSYQILLLSSQRENQAQDFNISIDSQTVGHIQPINSAFRLYSSAPFNPQSTSAVLALTGLNTATGDNSAFLDRLQILQLSPVQPTNNTFESPSLAAATSSTTAPTGWSSNALLVANGSPKGNPAAPDGTQVIGLEKTDYISQTIPNWPQGNYRILLAAAQLNSATPQDFRILIDGVEIWRATPPDAAYSLQLSAAFAVMTTGAHTLRIEGLNTAGGDRTLLIDHPVILFN